MWVTDSAGYALLLLAVIIVGWMSIFYIRVNIVKKDEPEGISINSSSVNSSDVKRPAERSARTRMDDNAITRKRRI